MVAERPPIRSGQGERRSRVVPLGRAMTPARSRSAGDPDAFDDLAGDDTRPPRWGPAIDPPYRPDPVPVAPTRWLLPDPVSRDPLTRRPLTPRQHEIMELLTDGLTRQEAAARLGLANHTVNSHVQDIYTRTGATNRVELTRWRLANELAEVRARLVRAIEFIDAATLFHEDGQS